MQFLNNSNKFYYLAMQRIKIYSLQYSKIDYNLLFQDSIKNAKATKEIFYFKKTFDCLLKISIVKFLFLNNEFRNTFNLLRSYIDTNLISLTELENINTYFYSLPDNIKSFFSINEKSFNRENFVKDVNIHLNFNCVFEILEKELSDIPLKTISNDTRIISSKILFYKFKMKEAKTLLKSLACNNSITSKEITHELKFYNETHYESISNNYYSELYSLNNLISFIDDLDKLKKQKLTSIPVCEYFNFDYSFIFNNFLNSISQQKELFFQFVEDKNETLKGLKYFYSDSKYKDKIIVFFKNKFPYNHTFFINELNDNVILEKINEQ